MADIFLADSEFETAHSSYLAKMENIEEKLDEYLKTLTQAVEEKNLQGKTADALLDFATITQERLALQIADIGFRFKLITAKLTEDVAAADDTCIWGGL